MTPIQFSGATQPLRKPDSMTDEECSPLPVARAFWQGYPTIVSCWQPTEEERQLIADGAPIFLHVFGAGMPPVMLSTQIEADHVVGGN